MAKAQLEAAKDIDLLLEGENVTAEQLDNASVEMLQSFTDFGLRCFAEQCRHWRAMVEFEMERRGHGRRKTG